MHKQGTTTHTNSTTYHTHIQNLSSLNFNNEEIKIMKLGTSYAFEKEPKFFVKELIIDTGNAVRHLGAKLHNAYRILASKKIKEIMGSNKKI
jgi:hypothetical protein